MFGYIREALIATSIVKKTISQKLHESKVDYMEAKRELLHERRMEQMKKDLEKQDAK